DLGSEMPGQLYRVHAHTSRSSVNQHCLSGADIRLPEHAQGREPAGSEAGSRLGKAHCFRFVHYKALSDIPGVLGQTDVFSIAAEGKWRTSQHGIPGLESAHRLSNSFHHTGKLHAEYLAPRFEDAHV